MEKLRVGYACLARLTFDGEYARQLFEQSKKALAAMDNVELVLMDGLTVAEEDAEDLVARFVREGIDVALIQYGTFSLGTLIPMFADFVAIDEDRNLGIGWHCGAAPTCLASESAGVAVCKHPTVGGGGKKGVTVSFPIRGGGAATMARLGVDPKGLRLFFAGGEAVDPGPILRGNPAGIRFDKPVREVLQTILDEGMEHHYAIVHADIRPELRRIAKWLDMPTIDVDAE